MMEVKIKAERYGQAIGLLLGMSGGFQTRFERTLIVNSEQRRALEHAGLMANGDREKRGKEVAKGPGNNAVLLNRRNKRINCLVSTGSLVGEEND
jgi:hypothetical protein